MNIIYELAWVPDGMHARYWSMWISSYIAELELLYDETKLMILNLSPLYNIETPCFDPLLGFHMMMMNEDCIGDEEGCFPFFSIVSWSRRRVIVHVAAFRFLSLQKLTQKALLQKVVHETFAKSEAFLSWC